MPEVPTQHFRTVADFLTVPPEKLHLLLKDFTLWLAVHHAARARGRLTEDPESFDWVDDGKHVATVIFKDPAGNEFHREVMDPEALDAF